MYHNNILETIGDTPLIKLNTLADGLKGTYLVKVEYFNPGQSVKDRIAVKMIEDAERSGKLKPGGTIIEGTSGNTGMGLALAAIVKGYNCIFTTTDKQSMEKVNLLRALGAEVKICPTNVEPDDPRSYYSVAKRLSKEIPNSYYPNQYDNPSNAAAHYETTGPEIWEQTEGNVTHYAAGMGTGGTITGAAKFLKRQNENIQVVGIDSVGSIYKHYFETGEFDKSVIQPYLTEGIGEDIIPENVDMDLIDDIIQVSDKDAFLTTRALAKKEGLFVGGSCGAAVWGALEYARNNPMNEDDVMVIILPDSGTRYTSKIYNDEWMQQNGFMEGGQGLRASDIIQLRGENANIQAVKPNVTLNEAIEIMNKNNISQLPVMDGDEVIGGLSENRILNHLVDNPGSKSLTVDQVMDQPFPIITPEVRVDQITQMLNSKSPAVLVEMEQHTFEILTKSDLINALSHNNNNNV